MFTPAQIEQLLRPVNPRRVQRDNHGMSHLAAYDVSAHLTRIFGFGGWRKEVLSLELVAEDAIVDESRGRLGWFVTYRCSMRLHVGDWWNDDGATGSAANLPDRGDAHDFALKNAISYALKRCAKDLGDQFGLSLYNKGSTAALVGRTLVTRNSGPMPPGKAAADSPAAVDSDVPDLAPDWAERPPERDDGLPTNADGSLSRSRTTDAEKDAAGVMTAAQQSEHTRLQPKRADQNGTVTRMRPVHLMTPELTCACGHGGKDSSSSVPAEVTCQSCRAHLPSGDPWLDQPAAPLEVENHPGTVSPQQQRAIHAACTGMDRDKRLATISDIVGRQVTSSNELSYTEAATVLAKLSGVRA